MPVERTLALIKPDVCGRARIETVEKTDEEGNVTTETVQHSLDQADEIVERIEAAGFTVVKSERLALSQKQAQEFYKEHRGKPFFNKLTNFMSSGTCCALMLEKENAILEWRALMGKTNTQAAIEDSEKKVAAGQLKADKSDWPLRAIFGSDATRNATHGSDAVYTAARELDFFFPDVEKMERTLAVMGPKFEGKVEDVIADVEVLGFVVLGQTEKDGSTALALEAMNAGLKLKLALGQGLAKYTGLTQSFEGDTYFPTPFEVEHTLAIIKPGAADHVVLTGEILNAVEAWGFEVISQERQELSMERAQLFADNLKMVVPNYNDLTQSLSSGPLLALVLAKPSAVKSFQALSASYPDACYASETASAATRDISFLFPTLRKPFLITEKPSTYLKSNPDPSVHKTLLQGLAALCKQDTDGIPNSVAAAKWLGQWLLDNNPGKPGVADAEVDWTPPPPPPPTNLAKRLAKLPNGGAKMQAAASDDGVDPIIIFVVGGPGSGKGTQCANIVKEFGFTHLSSGDLLRAEVASGSALGKKLEADMAAGALVDFKVVLYLLKKAMNSGLRKSRFLIDGFPRELEQAFEFERKIGRCCMVLNFFCEESVMRERLLQRGKTSGRADDNAETIEKRFTTFRDQSKPVIEFYQKLGLVRTVDASFGTPADVYKMVRPLVCPKILGVVGGPDSKRSEYCAHIAAKFGYEHVSLAATVEQVIAFGGKEAIKLSQLLDKGEGTELPVHVAMDLVYRIMKKSRSTKLVFEDFPKTKEQALAFEARFGASANPSDAQAGLFMVLNLECDNSAQPWYAAQKAPLLELLAGSGVLHSVDATQTAATVHKAIAAKLEPEVVFVVGGGENSPSSGKAEKDVCAAVTARYKDYTHLDIGHMVRVEVVRDSAAGKMLDSMIQSKQQIPSSMTVNLLKDSMRASGASKFVINGFPRTTAHAEGFESKVGTCSKLIFLSEADASSKTPAAKEEVVGFYARQGKVTNVSGKGEDMAKTAVDSLSTDISLLWGGPGSVSTEVGQALATEHAMTYLSFDAMVKSTIERGTPEGAAMKAAMDKQGIISKKMKVSVVKVCMAASKSRRFLLEGFPKTADEAKALEEAVAPVRSVFYVKADHESLAKACVAAEKKARGHAPPSEDADPEEEEKKAEEQIKKILDMVESRPWDLPEEVVEGPGQNWHKSLAEKPGFVIKKADREISMEEGIAKQIALFSDSVADLEAYFASFSTGIHVLPSSVGGAMESAAKLIRSTIVPVVGAAGSGKDAAVTKLCIDQGYRCICVPELLDAAVADGAPGAATIAQARALGRTPPAASAVALIKAAMRAGEGHKFVLDGFPKLEGAGRPYVHDQYFLLEKELGAVAKVVAFDAPKDVRQKRCLDAGMGANEFEDSEDAFEKQETPLIDFAGKIGKLASIDSKGQSGKTYDSFSSAIDSLPTGTWR